ncbi:dihydrofolate reductase family protein [Actinomycetospora corticicola]|uniref:Dihydrofolate reductase n=1 Tax=Actinomycetospora corticicola TaxID=663602 RepID=A0A7Y9DV93_9PSEU|nr:dihydrofolate reductase family protein [Actinomycetospora corticicola]NYD36168.1 dihydrofolate reductase [Actinomycetospora corticicola]
MTPEDIMHIVVTAFTSLDGVVQAPGGPDEDRDGGFAHGGWSMRYFDPEVMGAAWNDALASADAMLFGRRTWEVSGPVWSAQAGDPFADRMNAIPKYVVSRSLTDASAWANSTVLADPRRLPEGEGRLLVMGSPSVVRELVDADLVDEYRLMIEPVLLGGGKSIFPTTGNSRGLELVEATTAATGTLVCTYRKA